MKTTIIFMIGVMCSIVATAQEKSSDDFKNKNINGVISIERKDMIKIRYGQLPAVVRKTLQESDYKTWSVVAVYRTKQSDRFLLDLNDGLRTTAHWFDKTGTMLVQDSDDPALGISSMN